MSDARVAYVSQGHHLISAENCVAAQVATNMNAQHVRSGGLSGSGCPLAICWCIPSSELLAAQYLLARFI